MLHNTNSEWNGVMLYLTFGSIKLCCKSVSFCVSIHIHNRNILYRACLAAPSGLVYSTKNYVFLKKKYILKL